MTRGKGRWSRGGGSHERDYDAEEHPGRYAARLVVQTVRESLAEMVFQVRLLDLGARLCIHIRGSRCLPSLGGKVTSAHRLIGLSGSSNNLTAQRHIIYSGGGSPETVQVLLPCRTS